MTEGAGETLVSTNFKSRILPQSPTAAAPSRREPKRKSPCLVLRLDCKDFLSVAKVFYCFFAYDEMFSICFFLISLDTCVNGYNFS